MSTDLRPYPEYKDSGLPWLGRVPAHWDLVRMKHLLQERNLRGFADEPLLAATQAKGVVRKEDYENRTVLALKDLHLLKLVEVGDFVISLRSFQGGIEHARHRGIISPAYTVIYPCYPSLHAYLASLFKSRPFIDALRLYVTGIRQGQNIDYVRLSRSPIPVPPSKERAWIVRFVTDFDRRCRVFIRNRRRLIEVLNEQKQAIINRAVTRGIDPNAPLKPSGIEWIGEIPKHWELRRMKQVAKLLRGKFTHRPRNDPSLYDGAYPFIQTGDVSRATKKVTSYSQTLNERGFAVSKQFPAGTLCMTIAANIGDVAILDFEACFPDSIIGLVPTKGLLSEYFYYAMRAMKPQFVRIAPVTAQGNLNVERVGATVFALPPEHEQQAITEHIIGATLSIDSNITIATREIDLIREYRTRLIADVVTGKVDVRGIEVPEVSEEEMPALDEDNGEPDGVLDDELESEVE